MTAPETALGWLAAVVLVGLSAAGFVQLVRVIPPGPRMVARGTKPWACDLCMSWWTALVVAMVLSGAVRDLTWLAVVPGAFFVSLFVTARLYPAPSGGPGAMPPLEES